MSRRKEGPCAGVVLERRSAAELELLDAVVLPLGDRHGVVEAQRSEWRCPDEAHADRGTHDIALVILQSEAGAGVGRPERQCPATCYRASHVEAILLVSQGPTGRSL